MKEILIIYSKTGGGHLSLAQSVEEGLNLNFPGEFHIQLCDPFPQIYASGYKTAGANFQDLWGKYYKITDGPTFARTLHKINQVLVAQKLRKIIKQTSPDLVLSTYPLATQEVAQALEKSDQKSKIAVLFADPFTLHAVWLSFKDADLYLSPTDEVTRLAIKSGITSEKIITTGWPVRQRFKEALPEIKSLRKMLGFDESKFTIFLGGSGQGGGRIWEIAKLAARSSVILKNCQIIVVTGMNPQLMLKLMQLSEQYPKIFSLYPYNNNMPQLLGASDVVVGKAGPNLLFESIFLEKPFLATGCLPGQEEGNLEFIRREKLGWVIENSQETIKFLESLCLQGGQNPSITAIVTNLRRVKELNWSSSQKMAEEVYKLLASK